MLSTPLLREGMPIGGIYIGATGGAALHGQANRAAPDLRRPGRHRDRERPAVHGARGPEPRADRVAGAADGDERDPARHLELPHRRPAGVRHDRPERGASMRGHAQQPVPLRGGAPRARRDLRLHTGGCRGCADGLSATAGARVRSGPGRDGGSGHPHPRCHAGSGIPHARAVGSQPASGAGRADAARGNPDRGRGDLAIGGAAILRGADQAGDDLRRPGGDRDRERPAVPGARGPDGPAHALGRRSCGRSARSDRRSAPPSTWRRC